MNDCTSGTRPAPISTTPAACATAQYGSGRWKCQSFSRYGSRQPNVPPTATNHPTLLAAAADLRMKLASMSRLPT